jgi:hypothetical protein
LFDRRPLVVLLDARDRGRKDSMRDDIIYREEYQVLHDLVVEKIKTGGAGLTAAQMAALFKLGQKVMAALCTAPSGRTPEAAA